MIIYHQIRNFLNFDILQVVKFWKFANFRNWTISEIWLFYGFVGDENLMIFTIGKLENFWNFFQFGKPKFDFKNWEILEFFV